MNFLMSIYIPNWMIQYLADILKAEEVKNSKQRKAKWIQWIQNKAKSIEMDSKQRKQH